MQLTGTRAFQASIIDVTFARRHCHELYHEDRLKLAERRGIQFDRVGARDCNHLRPECFVAVRRESVEGKGKVCEMPKSTPQFYAFAVMYADERDGSLASYGEFLQQTPMLCPSDKSLGAVGKVENKLPTSFRDSPFVFAGSTRLDECPPSSWMLVEYQPYHASPRNLVLNVSNGKVGLAH